MWFDTCLCVWCGVGSRTPAACCSVRAAKPPHSAHGQRPEAPLALPDLAAAYCGGAIEENDNLRDRDRPSTCFGNEVFCCRARLPRCGQCTASPPNDCGGRHACSWELLRAHCAVAALEQRDEPLLPLGLGQLAGMALSEQIDNALLVVGSGFPHQAVFLLHEDLRSLAKGFLGLD